MRIAFLGGLISIAAIASAAADNGLEALIHTDRTIDREPKYQHQPHYSLLVFGEPIEHRAWLVIDGNTTAYIDRNGNGDLTDPGERVPLDTEATDAMRFRDPESPYLGMYKFPLGDVAGRQFVFLLWVRNPNFDPSQNEQYRDRFREWDKKGWRNGSLMRVSESGMQAQNPLLLTASPDEAQINHFGGPLTFQLKLGDRLKIEPWPKKTVFPVHIGTRNLLAKNCDDHGFAFSPLTTNEVPGVEGPHPIARFEASSSGADGKPVTWTVRLDQRCCGDTLYGIFTLPRRVRSESVQVTLTYPGWTEETIHPRSFTVPINKGLAEHGEMVFVMFHNDGVKLSDAVNVLRREGMDVRIHNDILRIYKEGSPIYAIRLLIGDRVRKVASSLGRGTAHAGALKQCSRRFEIAIVDIEQTLSDRTLLSRIETALRGLTDGYVYRTWEEGQIGSGE